jgi:hypothetical protein
MKADSGSKATAQAVSEKVADNYAMQNLALMQVAFA